MFRIKEKETLTKHLTRYFTRVKVVVKVLVKVSFLTLNKVYKSTIIVLSQVSLYIVETSFIK